MRPVNRNDICFHSLRWCIRPVEQNVRLPRIAKRLQHMRCSDEIALRIDKECVAKKRVAKPFRTGCDVVGINYGAYGCSKCRVLGRGRLLLRVQRRCKQKKQRYGGEARSNDPPIPASIRWADKNPGDWRLHFHESRLARDSNSWQAPG